MRIQSILAAVLASAPVLADHGVADTGTTGANSFAAVNPVALAGQGMWWQAILFAALWVLLLYGLWKLLWLVLGRAVDVKER